MYKRCDESPICYFEFVIDPHDFSNTIQNMFHVAFLVKDGHASIYLGKNFFC